MKVSIHSVRLSVPEIYFKGPSGYSLNYIALETLLIPRATGGLVNNKNPAGWLIPYEGSEGLKTEEAGVILIR